jgi:PAS domain S-box-containing protein
MDTGKMKDIEKTKEQLIDELGSMRKQIAELEAQEAERQRAEDKLRESEEFILTQSEVTRTMTEGAYIVGLHDVIIRYANPKFEKMFGYEPGEMIGKHASIVNAPNDLSPKERADEIMEVIRRTGEWHGEVNNIKKDGTPFWCYANVSVFNHPTYGEVLLAVHTDITKRKQVEEKLKEAQEQLRIAFESITDGVAVTDSEIRITNINEAGLRLFGYSYKEELIGRSGLELVSAKDHSRAMEDMSKTLEKGYSGVIEHTFLTKDGTEFLAEYTVAVITDKSGNPAGFVSVMRDITERKRAENVLAKSEEKYRLLFETAANLIASVDAEGIIVDCNQQIQNVLGYTKDEIIGQSMTKIIHPDFLAKAQDSLSEILNRGFSYDKESKMVRKDGTLIDVSINSSALRDEAGKYMKTIYIIDDITERKQAEEELMAALREKEVLIREVHHRVKNNLQVISSILDMSSLRIRDEQANDLILDARSKIHSMATIHSQLYTSGSFEQIDVGSHIREMTAYLFQIHAEVRNITPIVEFGTINLEIALAVPYAIVLNELVANALRHAFKGREKGMIKVSAEKLADGTILTRVKDDGIGISPEFDIAKVDTLGLKLVRNIIQQQLKGKIQIKRDKGTEFIIEFNP